MQTTGVLLDMDYLRFLRNHVGVSLISLSLSSLDYDANREIIGTPANVPMLGIRELCKLIKDYGFSLRLSLNMTNEFKEYCGDEATLFYKCRNLGADQVTLRLLYSSGTGTEQDEWIRENGLPESDVLAMQSYVRRNGKKLGVLPHGAEKYSIHGLCVVVDTDCMDKKEKTGENYKYLILQPDCRLYSQWDDPASLIF